MDQQTGPGMEPKAEEYWSLSRRIGVIAAYRLGGWSRWLYYRLIKSHLRYMPTITYLFGVASVSFGVAYFGDGNALGGDDSALFSTVGAMVAGMLAIVFALRVLLIQNATATQSSGLFDIMARDRWQNTMYWLLALISLSNIVVAATLLGSPGMLSFMSTGAASGLLICTTGIALWLVFLQLSRIYKRINPLRSIHYVKTDLLRILTQVGHAARLHAKYTRAKGHGAVPSTDSERLAASFLLLRPQLSSLFSHLTFLFDYHDKLYQQSEKTAARLVLRAVGEIASKYIRIRGDSFFVIPSTGYLVALSDSHEFFRDLLEQLVSKAKRYIQSDDNDGVTEIIRILENLTMESVDARFISEQVTHDENPLFEQCRGHLGLVVQCAGQHRHVEGLFQGAKSLGRIGVMAAKHGLNLEAHAISQDLHGAALVGILMRKDIIWGEAVNCQCIVLRAFGAQSDRSVSPSLSLILDYLRFSLSAAFASTDRNHESYSIPFQAATAMIQNLAERTHSKADKDRVSPTVVIGTCNKYRRFLRGLSEDIKSADSSMVEAAARSICQISTLLLATRSSEGFSDHRDEVQETLSWFTNQLAWFAHGADEVKHGHSYDSLVESAAKIGMRAVEMGSSDIACTAIKVIEELANAYAEKSHTGYRELSVPRIMKRACFVGLLAFKADMTEPLELLSKTVAEIDLKAKEQAIEASGETQRHSIQLIEDEVGPLYYSCRDEKYNHYPLVSSSQHTLLALIECSDIDDFCGKIWGFRASERYKRR